MYSVSDSEIFFKPVAAHAGYLYRTCSHIVCTSGLSFNPGIFPDLFPFYLQGEFRTIGWGVHSWGVGVGEGPRGTNAISSAKYSCISTGR